MVGTGLRIVQPSEEGTPKSLGPNCTINSKYGHKAQWRMVAGDRKLGIGQINALLPPTRKAKNPGNTTKSSVKK